MDKEFFGKQIDRLRNVYAASSLSQERIQVLWDRFKGERNDVFERALNHVIGEATTQALPAASKIAEACNQFRSDFKLSDALTPSRNPYADRSCQICRDDGWHVPDYDRFAGTGTVTACGCAKGRATTREYIAEMQRDFDKGRPLITNPRAFKAIRAELPYDKSERIEDRSGEWA